MPSTSNQTQRVLFESFGFCLIWFSKSYCFSKEQKNTKYKIKSQHFKTQVFKPNAYCLQVFDLKKKKQKINELQKITKTRKISKHKSSDPTHLYNTYKAQLKKKTNVYPWCYHMGGGRGGSISMYTHVVTLGRPRRRYIESDIKCAQELLISCMQSAP